MAAATVRPLCFLTPLPRLALMMHVNLLHDGMLAFLLPAALVCHSPHLCVCHSGTLALLLLLCLCFTVTLCLSVSVGTWYVYCD